MPKCSFCSKQLEMGSGKMVVTKTGKVFWFDNGKCEAALLKLGRDPRKFRWAGGHGIDKGKK